MKVLACLFALALFVGAEVLDFGRLSELYKRNITVHDIVFTLYTRKHGDNGARIIFGDKESLRKSGFDPKLPVKMSTHGYFADASTSSVQVMRKCFLSRADCNFITVDWSRISNTVFYEEAVLLAKTVGAHFGKFIQFLRNETNIDIGDVHAMGHSLGAQAVSYISGEFPNEKIGRITGFDPASPIFHSLPPAERLDPEDARIVDVIHSSTSYFGVREPVGTVDFYPNGGIIQPGCNIYDLLCHHHMSHRFFSYTVWSGKNYEGIKCNSLRDAEKGTCTGEKAPMGIASDTAKPGIYYVNITQAPHIGELLFYD